MTHPIAAAGYMIQDAQGTAIYGIGASVDEAWAEVVAEHDGPFVDAYDNEMSDEEAFAMYRVYGATAALLDAVKARGGAIAWDVVGGVACLPEEAA